MDYKKFIEYVKLAAEAHQEKPLTEAKAIRTFQSGESNLYFTHSLWCAITILLETRLPEAIRISGAEALLFHDVLEDTTAELPPDLSSKVKEMIQGMTFNNFNDEVKETLKKPAQAQLLKLYDKTATLYDGERKGKVSKEWFNYIRQLIDNVEKEYGELNIVILAKALIKNY